MPPRLNGRQCTPTETRLEGANPVPTYHEHQQLVRLIQELADLLHGQSRFLLKLARQRAISETMPDESSLHTSWQNLEFVFGLLTNHAQSLQAEFDRLKIVPPEQNSA